MIRHTVVAVAMLGIFGAGAAAGQSSAVAPQLFPRPIFPLPPTTIEYPRYYHTLEQCMQAIERVRDRVFQGALKLRQLTTLDAFDLEQPAFAVVGETARRCGARFDVETAAAADLPLLLQLFLHAGQDSVVQGILTRQLALPPPATWTAGVRARVLAHMIALAVDPDQVSPAQVTWAERRLAELHRLGWAGRLGRLAAYRALMQQASAAYDTTRLARYVDATLALYDSLPEAERADTSNHPGTAPYHQQLQAMARGSASEPVDWATAPLVTLGVAGEYEGGYMPITTAPPLVAAFWFRRGGDTTRPRPTRGRPSLVAFVGAECLLKLGNSGSCHRSYAVLRELHRQAGNALEITVMAHTHGYFQNDPPLEPAAEAERLRQYYFDYLDLPGALGVELTRFAQLPAPDRRRIEPPPPSFAAYRPWTWLEDGTEPRFGLGSPVYDHARLSAFLIDRDGTVVLQATDLGKDPGLLLAAIQGWLAPPKPRSSS